MSIKKDNISVTAIKYNSQDVNKVILDNKCVWCKAFIYTQGTLPTGVNSLTCRRSSTDEPTASTGEISNNGTIYYDDKLYWTAAASAGYRITYIRGSNSPVIVSGDITGTIASELTLELISGTISQGTLPTGVASITCYRKAYNSSSFSEYTGSTIYYGDQFYWTATASIGYDDPRLTYNSGSKVYTWKGSQGGSITSVAASGLVAGSRKSFTISFGATAGKALYGSWSKSSQTAYYGDRITVSDNSVTCYKWDAASTARWTVTVTASSDNAQYTYSAVTIAESGIDSVTAAAAFTAWNTRTINSYTITWKYLTAYPDTWTTETQTYKYGATPSKTVSNVASGKTRKAFVSWDNLDTVTGNRTITATYKTQFAPTIKSNYCTANRSSGAWYDSGTVITWTADDNYSFNGAAVKDTTKASITSGDATYSATPGYIKCTISSTNCTAVPANGSIIQVGKSITYTANSNYSYTEHATTPSNPPEHTVALGKTSYSRSCDYALITVSGTNCSANVANGYRKIDNEITWTANTNYAFDSSGKKTHSRVITGPGAYSVSASHGYYDLDLTNCHYESGDQLGWYPLGTVLSSTTVKADAGWSFNGRSTEDSITIEVSAEVPTTVSAKPTNFYITVQDGIGCYANVSSGMLSTSKTITWKASSGYAFNSSGATTAVQIATGPGTYSVSATHGYYTLSLTNCSYSSGNTAGWYTLGTKPSTTVKADSGWSFNGSGQDKKTISSSAEVPTTVSASPTYFYLTFTPTNCSCSSNSGYYTRSSKPSSVTWTPNNYYSFNAGSTQTNATTTISLNAPNTYSVSPQYVRANSIATGTYNASVNRNANTYYAADTVVTWTAKTNYYYDASGTTTSTNNNTKITAGASISAPNPTHIKCTISGTNCAANKTSGSILAVGDTITWTGNTGANSKYSFSNTNPNSTATATVALGTISYSKTASYLWYNVTTANGINCKAYTSDSYGTEFRAGWHLAGTKIYWKAIGDAYAMTTSNDTTLTVDVQAGNNNRIAMAKRYKLSISKMPNIASILAWRTKSPYENAATGSSNPLINISNSGASITETATIYYGDSITMSARSASHYHFPGGDNSHTSITNTVNNVTGNADWSPRVVINTYPVTIKAGSGVNSVFLSTNQNALSGSSSGTKFTYNSTVYGFAAINTAGYKEQSGWSYVGNGNIFRVGSVIVASANDFGTVSATQLSGPCTVRCSSNHNGLQSVYLSASSEAHFGSSSLNVTPGTTVYGFAVLARDVAASQVRGWTLISGTACRTGAIYRVGSKTPYSSGTTTFTINLPW